MEKMKNVSFKLKLSLIDKIKVISSMLGPNENTSSLVRHLLQKGFDQIPIENEKSKNLEVILSRLENGHKIRPTQLVQVFCTIRPFIGMNNAYLPQWDYVEILTDYVCKLLAEQNCDLTWQKRKIGMSEHADFNTATVKALFEGRDRGSRSYLLKELFNVFEDTFSNIRRSESEHAKMAIPYKVAKVIVMMTRFFLQLENKLQPIPYSILAKSKLLASIKNNKEFNKLCVDKYKFNVFMPGCFGSSTEFHSLQEYVITMISLQGVSEQSAFTFNFSRMVDLMKVLEILEKKGAFEKDTHDFDHGYYMRTRGSGMDLTLRNNFRFASEIRIEKERARDLLGVFRAIKKHMGDSYDYMLLQKGDI
jgi:hypothetical protein